MSNLVHDGKIDPRAAGLKFSNLRNALHSYKLLKTPKELLFIGLYLLIFTLLETKTEKNLTCINLF